jgi:hypothetical protein
MGAWTKRIEKFVFKFSTKEGEEARDYLDLDIILEEVLNEYKETRIKLQDELKEHFIQKNNAVEAILDLDKFSKILQDKEMEFGQSEIVDGLVSFPSKYSTIRAYIYAATSGRTNMNDISADNFAASLSRYGLENPIPSITARIAYFGNSETILELIEKAQKKLDTKK